MTTTSSATHESFLSYAIPDDIDHVPPGAFDDVQALLRAGQDALSQDLRRPGRRRETHPVGQVPQRRVDLHRP